MTKVTQRDKEKFVSWAVAGNLKITQSRETFDIFNRHGNYLAFRSAACNGKDEVVQNLLMATDKEERPKMLMANRYEAFEQSVLLEHTNVAICLLNAFPTMAVAMISVHNYSPLKAAALHEKRDLLHLLLGAFPINKRDGTFYSQARIALENTFKKGFVENAALLCEAIQGHTRLPHLQVTNQSYVATGKNILSWCKTGWSALRVLLAQNQTVAPMLPILYAAYQLYPIYKRFRDKGEKEFYFPDGIELNRKGKAVTIAGSLWPKVLSHATLVSTAGGCEELLDPYDIMAIFNAFHLRSKTECLAAPQGMEKIQHSMEIFISKYRVAKERAMSGVEKYALELHASTKPLERG